MISIEQIRAGRSLLNWTQKQLAHAANISVRSLSAIELGETTPRLDTLQNIQGALESHRVIFGPDHGVKLSGERMEIHKFEGATCQEVLLKDIVDQLRWQGGEVCTNGVDEWRYGTLKSPIMDSFYKDLHKYRLGERILVEKGFIDFVAPSTHYRWISKEAQGKLAYSVYHDSVAMLTWEPVMRLVIIRNATIAKHFQDQFESVWDNGDVPGFCRHLKKDEDRDIPWSMARAEILRKKVKKMGY